MKYKTETLKKEWESLLIKNKFLADVILAVEKFSLEQFKKEITITAVFRTKEEQEKIYGKGTKKVSPHQLWHAIDLRTSDHTAEEIKKTVDFINTNFNNNTYKPTAMAHEVNGFGMHFHIQFFKK